MKLLCKTREKNKISFALVHSQSLISLYFHMGTVTSIEINSSNTVTISQDKVIVDASRSSGAEEIVLIEEAIQKISIK